MNTNGVPIPPERARAATEVAAVLAPGRRVVLTTHVNADGDGVGSEVALWHLLTARGLRASIANPTPIPERFHFLLPEGADHSDRAAREIAEADVVVVLDISEVSRLGDLARAITQSQAVACIDHHVSVGSLPGGPRLVAPEAAATAELVFDFASALQWPLCPEAARALYVGILTDTGGFRFANTTPRVLRVAGALLEHGVDPETIYESVYASAPEGRVRLTAEVLSTLVVEPERGLAWVTVPPDALQRHRATADDLDGIVEYPRSIAGVRLALLFRQLANGKVKVSFRSLGDVDVAELAQRFGGGGHPRHAHKEAGSGRAPVPPPAPPPGGADKTAPGARVHAPAATSPSSRTRLRRRGGSGAGGRDTGRPRRASRARARTAPHGRLRGRGYGSPGIGIATSRGPRRAARRGPAAGRPRRRDGTAGSGCPRRRVATRQSRVPGA